jgi:cell division protease FtsH
LGNARNIAFWVVLFLLILALFNLFSGGQSTMSSRSISYSEFVSAVDRGEVSSVTLDGERVMFRGSDGQDYVTIRPTGADITDRLIERNVTVNARPQEQSGFTTILMTFLPFLLLIGVWIYFMNRMQGGGRGGAMGFGKSRAKLLTEKHGRVTFDDVAGIDEAKEELEEIVEFLRNPQKFSPPWRQDPEGRAACRPARHGQDAARARHRGRGGRAVLHHLGLRLRGDVRGRGCQPGARHVRAGQEERALHRLHRRDRRRGAQRGVGYGGGNDEREQTLNQLLVEMDGFEANEGIIIVAATNRPDVLDPALLRPGRFDRQVQVPNPDIKGREKILGVHARKVPLGPDVDLRIIARGTPGFSGADLANLVNEAALMAARVGRRYVTMEDFESAKDKVMMGAERRSMVMSEDEKKLTAYHEAGHAIVGLNVPQHDPIHKATIIPRGRALGLVLSLPERDQLSVTFTKYTSKIAMAMGGKVAEELIFGKENVTSGAASDIQQVSRIARAMVTQFGFSDQLGNIDYANEQQSYLGTYNTPANVSPDTQQKIDAEVRRIVDHGYETARNILTEKMDDLHRLAQGLLEYETLTGDEITKVIAGIPLNRGDDADNLPPSGNLPSITAVPKTKSRPKPPEGGLPEPT